MQWLTSNISELLIEGQVLIFTNSRDSTEYVAEGLQKIYKGIVGCLHGSQHQLERAHIISQFKKNAIRILVSTNVASRGLDMPMVKTVVNYDSSGSMEEHIHRVGRTGRAGDKTGLAITLIERFQHKNAGLYISSNLSEDT